MKDLDTFQFDIWTDGRWDMCAIRGNRKEGCGGLRHIWFVLEKPEMEAIVAGKTHVAEDGYHKLMIFGDVWTFYDMMPPNEKCGVMQVPFYRANIPGTFVKLLARVAKWTWAQQRKHLTPDTRGDKVTLEFDMAYRERICRLYGYGKGEVALDATTETRDRLGALSAEDKGFADRVEQIKTIARNSTQGFHQKASLSISKDWDGFYWVARTPSGHTILNGGLVNHGRDGKHDWSLHT